MLEQGGFSGLDWMFEVEMTTELTIDLDINPVFDPQFRVVLKVAHIIGN